MKYLLLSLLPVLGSGLNVQYLNPLGNENNCAATCERSSLTAVSQADCDFNTLEGSVTHDGTQYSATGRWGPEGGFTMNRAGGCVLGSNSLGFNTNNHAGNIAATIWCACLDAGGDAGGSADCNTADPIEYIDNQCCTCV